MRYLTPIICAIYVISSDYARSESELPDVRELIRDARVLAELSGNRVWTGYSDVPFGVLLVEEGTERLFCHEGPAIGFEALGIDPVLSCPAAVRQATFPPNLLASFPAVDGVPTIVIGTPKATHRTADAWVLTILHEHFHQAQFSWPHYYSGTEDLGLSGGDTTGMWMLEYPFPYDRSETSAAFRIMADRLIEALGVRGTDAFNDSLSRYWKARESARQTVSKDDWKYIELQLWQEGVARWTEGAIAALSDEYSDAAAEAKERVMKELSEADLTRQGRSAVYSLGAGEAMLLEAAQTDWRERYWTEPFSLGPQLERLVESIGRGLH